MKIFARIVIILVCLAAIPVTAVATAAFKQRFADGPNRVFSGGPLEAGELYSGPEPDWSFVNAIPTIEMQLLNPTTSRRIWTVEYDNRLFVWSGYMNSFVGRLWKSWPGQAEDDGRAILRIDGVRYERELQRIHSDPDLAGITAAISDKYPSRTSPATVESGDIWLFEAAPR